MSNNELQGKVAVITGGARNMGRAFAQAFARRGADVVVHYHGEASRADADETARLVRAEGRRALTFGGELAEVATTRALFDATITELGRVDIVVNNAGVVVKKPMIEITEADYDR